MWPVTMHLYHVPIFFLVERDNIPIRDNTDKKVSRLNSEYKYTNVAFESLCYHNRLMWPLRAKYFPQSDLLVANIGHNPNYVWRSIWSIQALIREGRQYLSGSCPSCVSYHFTINFFEIIIKTKKPI
jgi:hypothetical protein